MAEGKSDVTEHLGLKDVAKILGKNEAALRARIKRGNLPATTHPLPSIKKGSKRFRYLIPIEAVQRELEEIVRKDPVLQLPLGEDEEPNLYQVICELLSKQDSGLTLDELRWQLERFHGLSLTGTGLASIMTGFTEFDTRDGKYILQHPMLYQVDVTKRTKLREDSPSMTTLGDDAKALIQGYEQRINALETKLEVLIQLLSNKANT
ncbi:MAG: hypothetical protein O3A46_12100 [Candidatus Poribacteria bacterium]|nr:hypothetical protein [Candidatus Poribacteria bacterium]